MNEVVNHLSIAHLGILSKAFVQLAIEKAYFCFVL